jgi:peptide/nickel transport system permease protein
VLPRIGQYLAVIFIGVTVTFLIPRLSPSDPVEAQVSRLMTSGGVYSAEAIASMRSALTELYGLEGSTWNQYLSLWARLLRGDLGPSLSTYPTPVIELIRSAIPWTMGLLLVATFISWIIGNLLGGLASYYPKNKLLSFIDVVSQAVRPIPYYIMALMLVMLFAYVFPIFPISGAYPMGTMPNLSFGFFLTVIYHSTLPALSLIIIGVGSWFIGMKSLTSNIISEDYVVYAETAGLEERKILGNYVIRNALLPQITGLAMNLGMIFNGSLILEVIFTYPGLGLLLYQSILGSDYSLIMGISIFSIVGVATAVLILDLLYPLFDPRVRIQ